MFKSKLLSDNRVIGAVFGAMIAINAYAIAGGFYR